MAQSNGPSIHESEDVPEAPTGWTGGGLVHTGGDIHVREWINTDQQLRVGYAVPDSQSVAVEDVEHRGGDESNPVDWQFVATREERDCADEAECLKTALSLMKEYTHTEQR